MNFNKHLFDKQEWIKRPFGKRHKRIKINNILYTYNGNELFMFATFPIEIFYNLQKL